LVHSGILVGADQFVADPHFRGGKLYLGIVQFLKEIIQSAVDGGPGGSMHTNTKSVLLGLGVYVGLRCKKILQDATRGWQFNAGACPFKSHCRFSAIGDHSHRVHEALAPNKRFPKAILLGKLTKLNMDVGLFKVRLRLVLIPSTLD